MGVPIEIISLLAYHGPNIFGPQPGVLLRVRCDSDQSKHIRDAIKDGALAIGLIVAYLEVSAAPGDNGVIITVNFATPMPEIGKALATYVVDGLCAQKRGDATWDSDTRLFTLQQHRRSAIPPMSVIQLMAEAQAHSIPVLHLADGKIQFGYGVRGWQCTPSAFTDATVEDIPHPSWEHLGAIPIYAITGERLRSRTVERVAACLHAAGSISEHRPAPHVLDDADFATTLALLADPTTESAILGLRTADILQWGVAFRQCHISIITDRGDEHPPAAADTTEWVQALGVPMLIATDAVVLNTDDAALTSLAPYAPHPVVPLTSLESVFAYGTDTDGSTR